MVHLGDITKINGYGVPIPDLVVGGSPCQDLSVAGKRQGLDGERSVLFMDQIRLVKEMRQSYAERYGTDVDVRPRYMLWENVPGAFSSNGGEDFRIVLEETAKIIDKDAVIPRPPNGKWSNSGCILGDGWSIAWRVFDAQFWGVPQRRRRISLVADFGGQSAPQILFVPKGLSRNTDTCREKRKGTTANLERSSLADDCISFEPGITSREGGHTYRGVSGTLRANMGDNQMSVAHPLVKVYKGDGATGGDTTFAIVGDHENRPTDMTNLIISLDRASFNQGVNAKFDIGIDESGVAHTIVAKGPNAVCYAIEGNGSRESHHGCGYTEGDKSYTLNTTEVHGVCYAVDMGGYKSKVGITEDVSPTLTTTHYGEPAVCYREPITVHGETISGTLLARDFKGAGRWDSLDKVVLQPIGVDPYNGCLTDDKSSTLGVNCGMTTGRQAVVFGVDAYNQTITGDKAKSLTSGATDSDHIPLTCYSNRIRYIVRRLTPLECERLQGFPDRWTDIGEYTDTKGKKRKTSDASRYKALGNSIALPSWKWVLKRISAQYERDASMVSLFDGIGGFPLLWEQINGKGSCLWASEVDDFPIAVTKERFK